MPAGAKPGERRGGRQKGAKNKRTLEVEEIFRQANFNPVRRMIEMVKDPETSKEVRARLLTELSQYAYPKRKAVEHSGGIDIMHGVAHIPTPLEEGDWPFAEYKVENVVNGASNGRNGHANGMASE